MSKIFWGMQHLNENLLCAVRCELTGNDPERHELLEVAVVPLNHKLEIHSEIPLFNMMIRPENINEIDYDKCRVPRNRIANAILTAVTADKAADFFIKWYQSIGQKERKRIIPLAHGWPKQRSMFIKWLGYDVFQDIFSEDYRDTLICAHYVNDKQCVQAEKCVFNKQLFSWIAKQLNVNIIDHFSALAECEALPKVYKGLLRV